MANAGRVAIVPKGDYSSSTAYKRLDLVRYNEKAYVAKKASTGVLPTNTEYWMLMTSDGIVIDDALSGDSTNPVQNKVLKSAIDSIQTTSRATLSTAGWYRVAEYKGTANAIRGARSNSCEIVIKRGYGDSANEEHRLLLNSVYKTQEFDAISCYSPSTANHYVTKIRYVYVETELKAYIEIYYSANVENDVFAIIGDGLDFSTECWKALDFIPTSETVSGVTVTTTYDIPANASPVTDLDLKQFDGTETLTTSILDKALTLPIGNYEYSIGGDSYTGTDLPSYWYKFSNATVKVRAVASSIEVIVWGVNVGGSVSVPVVNYYNGSAWSYWQTLTTTADLANYLPLSGGEVNGYIRIKSSGKNERHMSIANSLRGISIGVKENGGAYIYDDTNAKSIASLQSDGNYIWYGTATGNLPLTGGGTVTAASSTPIKIQNTTSNADNAYISYHGTSTLGYLGFKGANNPIMITNDGGSYNTLLHTGNSAKVAIQESAPTDTTSLWVDTANKVTKAYIDGAWTQVA